MKKAVIGIIAVFTLNVFSIQPSLAQCIAGVPCLTADFTVGNTPRDTEPNNESPACDADFMNQIQSRAFMEAQRENVLAQTYIVKPDSVLEYSCADQIIGLIRPHATSLFSSTDHWAGKTIPLNIRYAAVDPPNYASIDIEVDMGANHIDTALNLVVANAMFQYLGAAGVGNPNFGHDFLGGQATGLNHTISGPTFTYGAAYDCQVMRAVWDLAKCRNLEAPADTFWTFQDLAAGDPRQLPEPGSCTTNITAELITLANNAGPAYPTSGFDVLDPLLDPLVPATSNADCQDPIPTGLQVTLYDFTFGSTSIANPSGITRSVNTYPEKVCPNPGCYYHGADDTCYDG